MSALVLPGETAVGPPPAAVVVLHNNMMYALRTAYPHMADGWRLSINLDGGVVDVTNDFLSGKMGFKMKIADIDPEMRKVRRYAGELLERYRVARQKGTDLREAIENLKRKPTGEAVYDD